MKKLLPFLFVILSAAPLYAARPVLKGEAKMAGGPLPFTVAYDRGRQDLAVKVRDWTEAWLPAAEKWLGIPCPRTTPFAIELAETVIYDWPGHPFTGQKMGGVNNWDTVRVEYASFRGDNPALLYHELDHYWFGYCHPFGPDATEWINEGAASFLPLAMDLAGVFPLNEATRQNLPVYWGETTLLSLKQDAPLERDIRKEGWDDNSGLYYSKTFYCHYLLFLRLGADGYRIFLRTLLGLGRTVRDNTEVTGILGGITQADWRELLTGWVFAGEYSGVAYADFADADCDGLSGAEEIIGGTDPLCSDTDGDFLPDGFERGSGRNPLVRDDDSREVLTLYGPFADGDGCDWFDRPRLERRGPDNAPAERFRAVGIIFKNGILWFRADPPPPAWPAGHDLMFCLLTDTDGNRDADIQYNFRLSDPAHPWRYVPSTGESLWRDGLSAGGGGCYEIAVPSRLLPRGIKKPAFYPVVWDDTDKKTLCEWYGWIETGLDDLALVERYGIVTDLDTSDHDRDLIPDRVELIAGTDPSREDPPETVTKLAPFTDGRIADWDIPTSQTRTDADTGTIPAGLDMRSVYWTHKNGMLFILVVPVERFVIPDDVFLDLAFDLDGDGKTDREFGFYPTLAGGAWMYDNGTGQSSWPTGLRASAGEVLEMEIPLTLIKGGLKPVRMLPLFFEPATTKTPESFPEWIPLDSP